MKFVVPKLDFRFQGERFASMLVYPCPICNARPKIFFVRSSKKINKNGVPRGVYRIYSDCPCFVRSQLNNFVVSDRQVRALCDSWNFFVKSNYCFLLIPSSPYRISFSVGLKKKILNYLKRIPVKTDRPIVLERDEEGCLWGSIRPGFYVVKAMSNTIVPSDHPYDRIDYY